MPLNFKSLNAAYDKIEAQKAEREKGRRIDEFAVDVLEALKVFKARGAGSVKVADVGKLLLEAGCTRPPGELYPPIDRHLEYTFKMKLIGVSNGRKFAIPETLPEIVDDRLTRVAVYKPGWVPAGEAATVEELEAALEGLPDPPEVTPE